MSTTTGTVVRNASPKVKMLFEKIQEADGSFEAEIEVFHGISKYDSCPLCTKKIKDDDSVCSSCKKIKPGVRKDFRFNMYVKLENGDFKEMTGFRRSIEPSLGGLEKQTGEEILEILQNHFCDAKVLVEYTLNRQDGNMILHGIKKMEN